MVASTRLNMGCGKDIRPGYVNVDVVALSGVDVVHDLNSFPYPFSSDSFDEIRCINVLEHLNDTVRVMEELHRICRNRGVVNIRVPYWNSHITHADPTHRRGFHKMQFEYFDPTRTACQNRPYYSSARFAISELNYFIRLRGWRLIRSRAVKAMLELGATYFCNVIHHIDVVLTAVK